MLLEKVKYPFLSRMRRPSGIAPKVNVDVVKKLGTTPQRLFELSLIFALFSVIMGFEFFPAEVGVRRTVMFVKESIAIQDVVQTRQENKPPPPPRPAIPIEAPGAEALDDVPLQNSELDITEDVPPPPPPNGGDSKDEEDSYFVVVEEPPKLIGGVEGLMRRVAYPDIALRAGIQGKVILLAYVNEKGDVIRADVLKGIGGGCDEAAVDALRQSKFIPGKQRGTPVKVKVSIMVRFELRNAVTS
ncbi:MAG: energy transducer TonB [Ignavibacteriae bacterium]|nr:energy transducer TonB [Ignavibacteriota bacterium]